ncbi:MAG: MFS transporter, partial [Dehalococcoidia bacterium]|nr:MFS transporter [Dehalococcoidia bacterium]
SAEAYDQLRAGFEQFGAQGAALFEHVMESLKLSLSTSITDLFFIGLIIVGAAWVINFFIKEIPLRKTHI